ncbi:L-threonylcarbamoyladenylate synthase [Synechococcus sp. CBW1002]|jgi:L-threonylcarbamoyladenylate synthase|uniref:L-threonylcarbamoyladenylate synthase n=1 Tax=Synechococcus sp. CBW1002 TaxID=1353134 RepID=UPI0018CDF468|nr:L-threonylcarbamoyladenylate synthase [Synechococcus sp. CBW1002]QPN61617.1 L-threonylcarbamoyladenylate synthase [Synechococcus sp. CBW1002]
MPLFDAPALAARLQQGGAALLPTDTLPALAARPEHAGQIWRLKHRPPDKPLILMAADLDQFRRSLPLVWQDEWLALAKQGWPGALTLVLPCRGALVEALHPGGHSLGLRVPDCAATRSLLRLSGPLATTSANRSGEPAATTADEAADQFPDLPLLAPLPWPAASGQASTVVAWSEPGGWKVLRQGALLPSALRHP